MSSITSPKRAAVVSLRFNPAFLQHLIAFAKAIRELGYEAEFLLDPQYRRFSELSAVAQIHDYNGTKLIADWTHAVILNASPENGKLAVALKSKNTKILYVYHEPWQMSLSYLRSEGLLATFKAIAAHRLTASVLKLADTVILESSFGLRVYQQTDARFNKSSAYFPQIYDDDAPADIAELVRKKQYFGFIGALYRSHGFDNFVSFMRQAFLRSEDLRFLIASRNPLPESVLRDPVVQRNLDKVVVRCGRPLSNDEINQCYAECFCIWNVYRRSTQSGVLPKALMFGTPVIASAIGSFPEYIEEGVNGRFVEALDTDRILAALHDMRSNLNAYAANCRQTFLRTFFYRAQLIHLQSLLS